VSDFGPSRARRKKTAARIAKHDSVGTQYSALAMTARRIVEFVIATVAVDGPAAAEFRGFVADLRKNVSQTATDRDAIEMLAQHIITKPVFDGHFANHAHARDNHISKSMEAVVEVIIGQMDSQVLLNQMERCHFPKITTDGSDFAGTIHQNIVQQYEKFFRTALPKDAAKLGIVYTPLEIVDFMIQSVEEVLRKEFGRSMTDEGVHILDPFTGIGTFIARLLQSGIINQEDLPRKYLREIHANEIGLLPYYLASITIENAYHEAVDAKEHEYTPFPGICLKDTFAGPSKTTEPAESQASAAAITSGRPPDIDCRPLRIVIGNPPYSIGQKSANDNARNPTYGELEKRIKETYVAASEAGLNKAATTPILRHLDGRRINWTGKGESSHSSRIRVGSMETGSTGFVSAYVQSLRRCTYSILEEEFAVEMRKRRKGKGSQCSIS